MNKNLIRLGALFVAALLTLSLCGQTATSIQARNLVNANIQPNGQRAITATTLNATLQKMLDAIDSAGSGGRRLTAPVLTGSVSGSTVSLSWTNVQDGYNYQVRRSDNSTFTNPNLIFDSRGNSTTNSASGTAYYQVRSQGFDGLLNSFWSQTYTANPGGQTQLGTPEFLSVTGTTSSTISLAWASVPNAESYTLDRSLTNSFTSPAATFTISASLQSFTDNSLTASTQYFYRIRATSTGYTPGGYAYTDGTTTSTSTGPVIQYGYTATEPYTDNSTAPTGITYSNWTGTNNGPIAPTWAPAAEGKYLIFKVPSGQSIKTTWNNTVNNFGDIPDQAFRAAFTVSGFTYYITRSTAGFSFDNGNFVITLQ